MLNERIREDEMREELVKIGMNDRLAEDLAFRYYNNEISLKDLEFVKMELSSKIENVKMELSSKIENVRTDLNNKMDAFKAESKKDLQIQDIEFKNLLKEIKISLENKLLFSNRLLSAFSLIGTPILTGFIVYILTKFLK